LNILPNNKLTTIVLDACLIHEFDGDWKTHVRRCSYSVNGNVKKVLTKMLSWDNAQLDKVGGRICKH